MTPIPRILQLSLVAAAVALSSSAHAVLINYSVGGFGPTVPPPSGQQDIIELTSYTGSVDLAPEVPQVAKINTLLWTLVSTSYTGPSSFNVARDLTLSAGTQSIVQPGSLSIFFNHDELTLGAGGSYLFDFGSYTVEVTPLQAGPYSQNYLGASSHDVNASFVLHNVPDAGLTVSMLSAGILGIAALRRKVA